MTKQTIQKFLLILLITVLVGLVGYMLFFQRSKNVPQSPSRIQWYPDKNGKFSPSVKAKDVETFKINLGGEGCCWPL